MQPNIKDITNPMSARPSSQAFVVLLGAQLAIGAAAIFARYALHGAGPVAASALRLSIAAVPIVLIARWKNKGVVVERKHEIMFGCCGVALAVHFATWVASLLYTSVAVSTLLVCTVPVWTALFDWLVKKKKMGAAFWWALLVAGIGIALIVTSSGGVAPVAGMELLGDTLAVIGSLSFAGYLIAIRSVSQSYPTIVLVSRTYSWAAVVLCVVSLLFNQMPPGGDLISWGGIFAMALVSQMLGHTGLNASLKWFSPSTVAFTTLLEPVFAAVLAALIFAEALSMQTLIGSLLVLGALARILASASSSSDLLEDQI